MAEYYMKSLISGDGVSVSSAGTSGEHDGEGAHKGTINRLKKENISTAGFKSRRITEKMAANATHIIVMDASNERAVKSRFKEHAHKVMRLTDFAPHLGYSEVPDPWYSGDFDETFMIVKTACDELYKRLCF